MPDELIHLTLAAADVEPLVEALDSHEYWQLGADLPRRDGLVFLPGEMQPDLLWEDREPSAEERDAIEQVTRCRSLTNALTRALG